MGQDHHRDDHKIPMEPSCACRTNSRHSPFLNIRSRQTPQIQFRKLCHKSETCVSARSTCHDMVSRSGVGSVTPFEQASRSQSATHRDAARGSQRRWGKMTHEYNERSNASQRGWDRTTHESNERGNVLGDTKLEAQQHPVELEPPPEDEISAQEESEVEDKEVIGDDDSMEEERRRMTQPW